MNTIKSDLRALCNIPGVAGMKEIAATAAELLRPLVDTVETDAMGNVLGFLYAKKPNALTIMLEAHLDEIGFLVTNIDDKGFVYTAAAGGIDGRVLTAQEVCIHTKDAVYNGFFCSTPPHLAGKDGELPDLSKRGIDVGMNGEEARAKIPLGSRVTFAPHFVELNDTIVSSKALDDRAGMAAILYALRKLNKETPINVAVAFCVQEELGCRGASPAVNRIKPNAALITDVSFALTPDADPNQCGELNKGVMIGVAPILDVDVTDTLFELAKSKEIPFQYEVMGGRTGTDADRVSDALTGVPCGLLSIPQRYMHTPVEVIDVRDVASVGDLMAAYILNGGAENE